jgi:hypothetical protein
MLGRGGPDVKKRKKPVREKVSKTRSPYRVESTPPGGRHPKCQVCGRAAIAKTTSSGAWIPFCRDCRGTVECSIP